MNALLKRILPAALVAALAVAFVGRGPDFPVEWSREVPSPESTATLSGALRDARNWPIFHHALKSVAFFENGKPVTTSDRIAPGMIALFAVEPKAKEWKRFEIRAEVVAPRPGESFRFRLLEESTGKTTRLLGGFEWWVGVRPANEAEAKRGSRAFVLGGATAETKTARARFFGRFSPKILMNQLYQIDLVRLANFTTSRETWAKEKDPVYR